MESSDIKKVVVVGLGYVGLPLAVNLSDHFTVIGFDVNQKKIAELKEGIDISGEVESINLLNSNIVFTANPVYLRNADFIIVCVPTPIDKHKKPDLKYLQSSSKTIGEHLSNSKKTVVVYESTVYPGVTEEECVPILEMVSGLKCGPDFKVGYSPERINPGDKERTIDKITKVVSGMDEETLNIVDYVYSKITNTHRASSIKVAESAKVIENIQRDLNIALMNELAVIFDKMKINVNDVLSAAGTKWNFHKYTPGLVGGHCIGVDPYYLTYKAEGLGHHPEVILAGRRINDNMHKFYAAKIIKRLQKNSGKSVLILGLTFKPNVADYRNSRVKHLIKELQDYGIIVYAFDPFLSREVVENEFGAKFVDNLEKSETDLIVNVVEHRKIMELINQGKIKDNVINLKQLN